jgi:hypothetical protein
VLEQTCYTAVCNSYFYFQIPFGNVATLHACAALAACFLPLACNMPALRANAFENREKRGRATMYTALVKFGVFKTLA